MPSVSSPVKDALESYVAGRVKAERLVVTVAAEYYRDTGNGKRETLRPLIDVIDRASPGIVELGIAPGGSGFEVRLVERPFPKQHEAELRRARSEEHTSELQSHVNLVCRLLLEK